MKLLITLALTCPNTIVKNETSTWNEIDDASLQSAYNRCVNYYPDSPCLIKFTKKDTNIYWAVCGEKR